MDPITLQFTPKDIENAKSYFDIQNCLLATALKRLGYEIDTVTGYDVRFKDGKRYQIDLDTVEKLSDDEFYPNWFVNRIITLTYLNQWKKLTEVTEEQFLSAAPRQYYWSEDTSQPKPYPLVLKTYDTCHNDVRTGEREVGRITYGEPKKWFLVDEFLKSEDK